MKRGFKLLLLAVVMAFALTPTVAFAVEPTCDNAWGFAAGTMTDNLTLYAGWQEQQPQPTPVPTPTVTPTPSATPGPTILNPQTGGGMTIQKVFIGAIVIALAVAAITFVWINKHRTE